MPLVDWNSCAPISIDEPETRGLPAISVDTQEGNSLLQPLSIATEPCVREKSEFALMPGFANPNEAVEVSRLSDVQLPRSDGLVVVL